MKKLLVIDDERAITQMIQTYFTPRGYAVSMAHDAAEGLLRLEDAPDIILLDIMMPGQDGLAFCQAVRGHTDCPIVFCSAKTEEQAKLLGFAAGGDDYVVKPFSLPELHARIEAHLRREMRPRNTAASLHYGALWIDRAAQAIGTGGDVIPLTPKEYAVLELLALHPGQVFSQERIYEHVWGYDAQGDAQTAVTEHIKRIRKKLGGVQEAEAIETVWGIGYRWKKQHA